MPKSSIKQKMTRKDISYRQAIYMVLAFGTLLASVLLFFADPQLFTPTVSGHFFSNIYNFYRVAIMLLAMVFLLLATKSAWRDDLKADRSEPKVTPKVNRYLKVLQILAPVLAIVFVALQIFLPEVALVLVRKESWPFFRNAIFIKASCQIIALVMFAKVALRYHKVHNYSAMVISVLLCLVLFVMAGEELSWGQRIFGWSTPESYAKINAQSETNLHNLATQAFQNTLYFGGWVLLVLLPFFSRSLRKLTSRSKHLKFIGDFLPPIQLIGIFALGLALHDPIIADTGIYWGSNLFTVIGTAVILIALIYLAIKSRSDQQLRRYGLLLVGYLVVLFCDLYATKLWPLNHGAPTEYLEMFISLGIMTWAIIVNSRTYLLAKRTISASAEDAD